jgi:hypothetical protein
MKSCCKKQKKGYGEGILYGLIPHIGCIAFIVFAVLGVTAATAVFKPLLLNGYFFYILIALSLAFATISATLYLRKNESLSIKGAKKSWKYLSVLYGTTVMVNLLFFLVIFPYAANAVSSKQTPQDIGLAGGLSTMTLRVAIPCPGHASLITGELSKIGVSSKFRMPNYFDLSYDSGRTSLDQIMGLDVFESYKATIVS